MTEIKQSLIQEMEKLRLEKPYGSAIERAHEAVLNRCIELAKEHSGIACDRLEFLGQRANHRGDERGTDAVAGDVANENARFVI